MYIHVNLENGFLVSKKIPDNLSGTIKKLLESLIRHCENARIDLWIYFKGFDAQGHFGTRHC